MSFSILQKAQRSMRYITITLGALTVVLVAGAVMQGTELYARLLPLHMRGAVPWKTITAVQMDLGTTAPASTNVIFQMPADAKRTTLDVLTGYRGRRVRFWGYCFPEEYNRDTALKSSGFPGKVFLSKKERQERERQQLNLRKDQFSIYKNLTEQDLNQDRTYNGVVRHQIEVFPPNATCYLMTQGPIPVGTDRDDDFANTAVERDIGSDEKNPDTDADGVKDGLEIFFLGSNPILRDSDGDGIIDGIEDFNRNGRRDETETDATKWDTDNDGLCDGLCRVEAGTRLRGEDKNLNGVVDEGESNPLHVDSDGDGVLDYHETYLCELANGANC